MNTKPDRNHIIIAPQFNIGMASEEPMLSRHASTPSRTDLQMICTMDGNAFRLDIELPPSSLLNVFFPNRVKRLYINGESIWDENDGNYTKNREIDV